MTAITQAVGNRAPNTPRDVETIQRLLNKIITRLTPYMPLVVDGDCGPITVGLIIEFQHRFTVGIKPDGRIDPGKNTLKTLIEIASDKKPLQKQRIFSINHLLLQVQQFSRAQQAQPKVTELFRAASSTGSKKLTDVDYQTAANLLGVEVAAVKAVAKVESAGGGFLSNGRPKILFEGHWFSKFTKNQYDKQYPSISYKNWSKSHYIGGAGEYKRYDLAKSLDLEAAQKSTSWGKFQIMGFNHKKCGYSSVSEYVKAMGQSEGKQLEAFAKFLQSTKLDSHLKAKNWSAFAKGYNGPGYAKNQYDVRLKQAYKAFSGDR